METVPLYLDNRFKLGWLGQCTRDELKKLFTTHWYQHIRDPATAEAVQWALEHGGRLVMVEIEGIGGAVMHNRIPLAFHVEFPTAALAVQWTLMFHEARS